VQAFAFQATGSTLQTILVPDANTPPSRRRSPDPRAARYLGEESFEIMRFEQSKPGIVERVRARRGRDVASAPTLRPTARYGTNEAKTSVGFELETD
jgi:hypothetical protein